MNTLFDITQYETPATVGDWAIDQEGDDPEFITPGLKEDELENRPELVLTPPPVIKTYSLVNKSGLQLYQPKGSARGRKSYWRFYYWCSVKKRAIWLHIRGGCSTSPTTIRRVNQVQSWLAAHKPTHEIVEVINQWS